MDRFLKRIDAFQRSHRPVAFLFGVLKKFSDDQAGNSAALVAYYGFFSLFPLLLVFVTVLGFVLRSNRSARAALVHSALNQFPVVGAQIGRNIHGLSGSPIALGIGLIGALWAGLGAIRALETAMNQIWDVPGVDQPNFLRSVLRALLMLLVVGGSVLFSSVLSGSALGASTTSTGIRLIAILTSFVVNLGVFLLAFRILTVRDVSWADVAPGAYIAAVGWVILQTLGGYYVGHQVASAGSTYGTFALVIGLLSWLYLASQVVFMAAEVNVVRVRALWPRGLQAPLTDADRSAYAAYAKAEQRVPQQDVVVDYRRSSVDASNQNAPSESPR